MSAYDTSEYEFSFAQRTLKNYEFIKNRVEEERKQGINDNDISDAFEVTQLINSFVGLLVIPRQKCFKYMPDDIEFQKGSEADILLKKLRNDKSKCEDCYFKSIRKFDKGKNKYVFEKTDEYEELTPKVLALRLRNAVSHDHLKIQPLSPGPKGIITGIEFSDMPTGNQNGKREYFRLELTISEIETLVIALSELLLSCYPKIK